MILFLDKPLGFTSFGVIKKLKRIRKGEKIGHAGTLDPNASGLLIVAIGKDTKRLHGLTGLEKSYKTTIDFTQLSDTRDTDKWERSTTIQGNGDTLSKEDMEMAEKWGRAIHKERTEPTREAIDEFCKTLVGTTDIALTPFSAKKIQGKKLYEFAREGNPVHKTIPMTVIDYTIHEYSFPYLTIEFTVGSGTYIRSLGYTIGNHFGWGGILTALKRTSIGKYSLDQLK